MTGKRLSVHLRRSLILAILAGVLQFTSVYGADLTREFTYKFDKDYSIHQCKGFDLIKWTNSNCSMYSPAGSPLLPMKLVRIVVPQGFVFAGLKLDSVDSERLKGTYNIYPAQTPVPLSAKIAPPFNRGDSEIYSSISKYPGAPVESAGEYKLAGYNTVFLKLHPFQYIPGKRELFFNSSISFSLFFTESLHKSEVTTDIPNRIQRSIITGLAENPEDMEQRSSMLPLDDSVEYLIITDADLVDEFQPLADWYTSIGIRAEIVTTSYIISSYTGQDVQKKIQNCIRDYYQSRGLIYALLGGDDIYIPDRNCYVEFSQPGGTVYTSANMPSDIYYSALSDDNWDDDGDGQYAEFEDDTVNLEPDVFVGRAPVRTEADAIAFVNKVLIYSRDPPATDFGKEFLLSGNVLWHRYWGDDIPDGYDYEPVSDTQIKCDTLYNDYIAPNWSPSLHKFFDTFTSFDSSIAGDYDLTSDHLFDKINTGYNLLYMAAHGNPDNYQLEGGSRFYTYDAFACANLSGPTVIYTIACNTNRFDGNYYDPCLSEGFIRNADGGAVAYIGSSRFGWGVEGFNLGTSMRYGAEFFTTFLEDNHYVLGQAFALHKENFIWEAYLSPQAPNSATWLMYSLNLMGDPAMPMWTEDPSEFSPAYPQVISTGPQPVTINSGVEGSRICFWKTTEIYLRDNVGVSGDYITTISPSTIGTVKLTLTKQNYRPFEVNITVVDYDADQDTDGLPDGFELLIVNDNNSDEIEDIYDVLASDDYDGDSQSNGDEYLAGTDPTDENSFRLHIITDIKRSTIAPFAYDITIEWDSVNGDSYSIHYSDGPFGPAMTWTLVEEGIPASGTGANVWTDDGSLIGSGPDEVPNRYYKIEIFQD